jgi:hypothetical protein
MDRNKHSQRETLNTVAGILDHRREVCNQCRLHDGNPVELRPRQLSVYFADRLFDRTSKINGRER